MKVRQLLAILAAYKVTPAEFFKRVTEIDTPELRRELRARNATTRGERRPIPPQSTTELLPQRRTLADIQRGEERGNR